MSEKLSDVVQETINRNSILNYFYVTSNLIPSIKALEAEVKALREKAEKWDILEKTSKGILTDNYYKMKIKAEAAESRVAKAEKLADELLTWQGHLCNSASIGHQLKAALRGVGGDEK